jgi:hypothetical protein
MASRLGKGHDQLNMPLGLRFAVDGVGLVVADFKNNRVSMFNVEDGSFVRHVATGLASPRDVEECAGGWLVACIGSDTVEWVRDGVRDVVTGGGVESTGDGSACGCADVSFDGGDFVGRARLGGGGSEGAVLDLPAALALVPGLGLVVREFGTEGQVRFFTSPDTIAMACMSTSRVGWMVAVARAISGTMPP